MTTKKAIHVLAAIAGLIALSAAHPLTAQPSGKGKTKSAAKGARPTLRVAQGQTFNFSQYKVVSPLVYGPDGRIRINDIKKAWADVSDVIIGGTLEITRTDPGQRVHEIFVVNRLEISPGGRILTNGNNLTIFTNELVAGNNAAVVAFDPGKRKAAPGSNATGTGAAGNVSGAAGGLGPTGGPGTPGESGGTITIFATNFEGPLLADLTPQAGGDGGTGGTGGPGARGHKGEDGESGVGCNRDGGQGGTGGQGGAGGPGGVGGHGGDGGSFALFFVKSLTVNPPQNPKVTTVGGAAGGPGSGGPGGPGGGGGEGGNGQGFCHGGSPGVAGADGGKGAPGAPGHPGVAGSTAILKLSALAKIQEAFAQAVGK